MSSMRKAAAGPLSLSRPQHGSKWCLALAEAWLPNCSCTSSRQSKVEGLTLSAQNPEEGAGQGVGWGGEEQLPLLCPRRQRGAVLPCQTVLKDICGTVPGRVKARFTCSGTSPALLNPKLSFPPRCGAAGAWQQLHDPAVINAAGRAAPLKAPGCSAISLVQSRGIIHISDKRIGY